MRPCRLSCFAVALLLFSCALARAAEFRAELHLSQPGETAQASLYVKGERYRVEKLDGPPLFLCITLQDEGVTVAMNPEEKTFRRLDGASGAFADPLLGFAIMAGEGVLEPVGTVEYGGRDVEHRRLVDENVELEEWFDPELGYWVKRLMRYGGSDMVMELKNIQAGPQDDALFTPPEGYDKEKTADEIEMEHPAIDGVVRTSSPGGGRLVEGGTLEVVTQPQWSVRVKVENLLKEELSYTVRAFSGGSPSIDEPERSDTLKYKGERKEHLFGMQNRADLVTVEVHTGRGRVTVFHEPEAFGEVLRGEHWLGEGGGRASVGDETDVTVTLVGDSPIGQRTRGRLLCLHSEWNDEGQQVSEEIETYELDLAFGESRELSLAATKGVNKLEFELEGEGGLKVITSQARP